MPRRLAPRVPGVGQPYSQPRPTAADQRQEFLNARNAAGRSAVRDVWIKLQSELSDLGITIPGSSSGQNYDMPEEDQDAVVASFYQDLWASSRVYTNFDLRHSIQMEQDEVQIRFDGSAQCATGISTSHQIPHREELYPVVLSFGLNPLSGLAFPTLHSSTTRILPSFSHSSLSLPQTTREYVNSGGFRDPKGAMAHLMHNLLRTTSLTKEAEIYSNSPSPWILPEVLRSNGSMGSLLIAMMSHHPEPNDLISLHAEHTETQLTAKGTTYSFMITGSMLPSCSTAHLGPLSLSTATSFPVRSFEVNIPVGASVEDLKITLL